ncbi:nucleoid-associated protein [uncultured Clostridium sp.]|uniref:nucleoid-associated protein n=1 Tax=uncultured Clostridium sp. TaxID=59620 RepID=UPI0028E23A53|nr:nucleoid-associated protein [uncultured Clostridium sp.]
MDYINEININEAVIHVLDSNAEEPILNEFCLELDEDIYTFLYKHIDKCLKNDEVKYAKFNEENNLVKETVIRYLDGNDNNLVSVSKKLVKQLFNIMKSNVNIPSADLIIVSITTDQGPMIGILKLDYVKNFIHDIKVIDEKVGVGITHQMDGLPGSGQKIQKAAFIKPFIKEDKYNLLILDKQKSNKEDEYGLNYFVNTYLGASYIANERDMTKVFVKAAENWTRRNIVDDAGKAEEIRTSVKKKLKEEDSINIDEFSQELFQNNPGAKEDFQNYILQQGLNGQVAIDKTWIDKKMRRVRLNIDKKIDLYIDEDVYNDTSKFEVHRNGDGTINLIVKNVINYIEK